MKISYTKRKPNGGFVVVEVESHWCRIEENGKSLDLHNYSLDFIAAAINIAKTISELKEKQDDESA